MTKNITLVYDSVIFSILKLKRKYIHSLVNQITILHGNVFFLSVLTGSSFSGYKYEGN